MDDSSFLILTFMLLGILGAGLRVLMSLLGTISSKKRISPSGSFIFAITTIAVGALCGVIIGFGNISAFLGGYAGIDIIDGIYSKTKKASVKKT